MKKIVCAAFAAMLVAAAALPAAAGCSDGTRVRLCEVTHSVFYAPLYVALNNGYFSDRGLEVTLTNAGGTDKVTAALVSGSADIGLMGPEGVIYASEMNDAPVVFGQLTKRDGSFLVSKKDEADTFEWSDLEGKQVLAGRVGGVPAMTMQYIMNGYGLYDGVNCTINTEVAFNMMGSVFEADDDVDYTTLFEPTASEFEATGADISSRAWARRAAKCRIRRSARNAAISPSSAAPPKPSSKPCARAMNLCAARTLRKWRRRSRPRLTARAKSPSPVAVESYLETDAWCSTPVMTEESLARLAEIMKNAGELDEEPKFSDIVDNSLAEEIEIK